MMIERRTNCSNVVATICTARCLPVRAKCWKSRANTILNERYAYCYYWSATKCCDSNQLQEFQPCWKYSHFGKAKKCSRTEAEWQCQINPLETVPMLSDDGTTYEKPRWLRKSFFLRCTNFRQINRRGITRVEQFILQRTRSQSKRLTNLCRNPGIQNVCSRYSNTHSSEEQSERSTRNFPTVVGIRHKRQSH